jgi:pimeloyl-ACP methyl ester carboxylesterase
MRIDNDGVHLHVQVDGQGPPLVLLHGITTSAATYGWLTPRLASRFRTHALDFRGHGSSDRAPGAYEIRHFTSDAAALLDHLGGEPAVVIGHSLGGVVGACLGQQRPEEVRALFLEDPALHRPGSGPLAPDSRLPDRPIGAPGVVLAPDPDAPDGILKPGHLDELRALNPGLRIEVVAGAGHMIHDSRVHRPTYLAHLDELLADLSS